MRRKAPRRRIKAIVKRWRPKTEFELWQDAHIERMFELVREALREERAAG